MSSEKSFQGYFMKVVPHGYRTSLVNGGGFPDILVIKGSEHFLVELKVLKLGVTGNKKLKGLFKPSQVPWYLNYLKKGGRRIYVALRVEREEKLDCYGLLEVSEYFCRSFDILHYKDLKEVDALQYKEYKTLKELIDENFS